MGQMSRCARNDGVKQGEKRGATGRRAVPLPFRSACGVDGHRQGFAANRRGKLAATSKANRRGKLAATSKANRRGKLAATKHLRHFCSITNVHLDKCSMILVELVL